MKKPLNKLLSILITINLILQPLSANFLIQTKDITFQTNSGVIIQGSQIQTDVVNFTAESLPLVSSQNNLNKSDIFKNRDRELINI